MRRFAAEPVVALGFVRFPVAWFAAGLLGSRGVWPAFAVTNVFGGVVAYRWFRRGTWRECDLTGRYESPVVAGAGGDD